MRDRGKLIRALLVVASAGAVAAVILRRRAQGAAASPALPADVRSAIDDGVDAGHNGTPVATPEPQWIPVAAAAPDAIQEHPADTGLAASA